MTTSKKSILALLATVLLFSFSVVIARGTVLSVPPMTLFFLRMLFAVIAFLPFICRSRLWNKEKFTQLVFVSLLSTVNIAFFIWGIQYTSASASQLIYALQPILIVMIDSFYHRIKHPLKKIFGVIMGFAGILFIVYLSFIEKGATISGSITGNFAIMIAMFGWLFYNLLSKKISKTFSPIEIGSISILITFLISIPLMVWEVFSNNYFPQINLNLLMAAGYMGFFGTFLTYILYQYAIKHVSSLTVSLFSYIQPVSTTIIAMIFLGEKLTIYFILGSALVFSGIFLTSTLEVFHRIK